MVSYFLIVNKSGLEIAQGISGCSTLLFLLPRARHSCRVTEGWRGTLGAADLLVGAFLPGALLPSHNNCPMSGLQTGRRWGPLAGTRETCEVAAGKLLPSWMHAGPHPSHGNPGCCPHARDHAGAGSCPTVSHTPG